MNIEKLKQTTLEDYQRRLDNVIVDVIALENEPSGLFKRILQTDRQILHAAIGNFVDVSQASNINNRDELTFFETLIHLFNYYFYDDGELAIRWEHYIENFGFIECDPKTENARPCLGFLKFDDERKAREQQVHWLLDWHEADREKTRKDMIELWGEDDEDVKCFDKKEFIDYGG